MSSRQTSRFLDPLLRWIFPYITDQSVYMGVGLIRKTAHIVEYAILSILLWCALRKPVVNDRRPWRHRDAFLAFGLTAAYSLTDEFHQLFVPSREGSLRDVGFDTGGALIGVLLVWLVGRLLKRW